MEETTHVHYSTDDLEKALTSNRTFKTNMRHIINHVGVNAADARQLLVGEWLLYRYPEGERIDDVTKRLLDQDPVLMWSITYARRQIETREYALRSTVTGDRTDDFTENDAAEIGFKLADTFKSPHGYPIKTDNVIAAVFSHAGTREFIRLVLMHGKAGALEVSGMTRKQFSNSLRRVEKQCDTHRDDIYKAINQQEHDYMDTELRTVNDLINILEADLDSGTYANQVKHFLLRHQTEDVTQRMCDTAGIDSLTTFLANFGTASHKQVDYRFVNAVYEERQFLEQELERFGSDSLFI